jgi:hypothetical protein
LNRGDALWKRIDKGALKDFVAILGSVPVTGETLRKHRKNKPVFGHITRYRDTTKNCITKSYSEPYVSVQMRPPVHEAKPREPHREPRQARW